MSCKDEDVSLTNAAKKAQAVYTNDDHNSDETKKDLK